ncbi:MAG: hypothetical protein QW815_08740, partial [Nitrososphaerota archaeon]
EGEEERVEQEGVEDRLKALEIERAIEGLRQYLEEEGWGKDEVEEITSGCRAGALESGLRKRLLEALRRGVRQGDERVEKLVSLIMGGLGEEEMLQLCG